MYCRPQSGGYNDQAQVPRAWTASSVFTVLRSAISAATLGQRLRTQSSAFPAAVLRVHPTKEAGKATCLLFFPFPDFHFPVFKLLGFITSAISAFNPSMVTCPPLGWVTLNDSAGSSTQS